MKIRMLPSAFERPECQYLTTFLVNDDVAVDAGCLGFYGRPDEQAAVGHVFLTHSHADHVCSLPMFISNVFDRRTERVVVHGPGEVLDSLRRDVFNDRLWPDFLRITHNGVPLLLLEEVAPSRPCVVNGLTLTPVPVTHPVATVAYVVDDGTSAVAVSTDSGPTDALWEVARATGRLKAVFLGTAYPDEERELARKAGHLTPSQVGRELDKLPADVPVMAVHLKPSHQARIVEQLQSLKIENLSIGVAGRTYVL